MKIITFYEELNSFTPFSISNFYIINDEINFQTSIRMKSLYYSNKEIRAAFFSKYYFLTRDCKGNKLLFEIDFHEQNKIQLNQE